MSERGMRGVRWRPEGFEGQCSYCGDYWPLEREFWWVANGLRRCAGCWREYHRASEAGRRTSEVVRDSRNASQRIAYHLNKEKRLASARLWRAKNKERIAEYNRRYRAEHHEETLAQARAYYAECRDVILLKKRQAHAEKAA